MAVTKIKFQDLLIEEEKKLISLNNEYKSISDKIEEKEVYFKNKIDILEKDRYELLFAGISGKKIQHLTDCAYSMTDEAIHAINNFFKIINKSPYSCSVYSGEKDWGYTEPDSYTATDHFNFYSRGQYHKLTTTDPIEEIKNKFPEYEIGRYSNDVWFVAKFKVAATCFDKALQDAGADTEGCYEIVDVFKKDLSKVGKLSIFDRSITDAKIELNQLNPNALINNINKTEKNIKVYSYLIENKYTSLEQYEKKHLKLIKEKYQDITEILLTKIASKEIKGSVTKREWSKSRGRFVLQSEKVYEGSLIKLMP